MDKIKAFLYRRPVAFVVGLLAFANPFLFYLSYDFHTSFATAVPGIDVIIPFVQYVAAVYILAVLFLRNLGLWPQFTEHKAAVIAYFVLAICTVLCSIANVVLLIVLSSSIPMARFYFAKEAPFLVGFGIAVSMAFVLPRLAGDKVKIAVVVAVYLACGLLLVVGEFGNVEPFVFSTEPVVFDTGEGYSIVWGTSTVSTGYVTYTYAGVDYEADDANYGRLASNRYVHHVEVPYEHLDGNTYTVHATQMRDNAPYLPHRGKTITTWRTFKGRPTGDVKMIAITDSHCLSHAKFARVRQDDYNVVLMLGDNADFMHQEIDLADFLLYPAGLLSHGEVPVLYAKGNHDTHSEMGADLAYLLGFDNFYYRVTYGDYTFTVLDSGSCNVDLEEEKYGGVGRYIPYREVELDWMDTLAPAAGYEIAIVHVWDFASSSEGFFNDQSKAQVVRYNNRLQALGVDFQLSGHKHDLCFLEEGADGVEVPILRCGGISAGYIGHSLTYTVLDYHQGQITMTGYNTRKKDAVWQGTYQMH